jgi:hypothetical protein
LIVAKGNIVLVLYHLHAKLSTTCVNALQKQDACDWWHKRPKHMSDKGMKVLVKKKVLKGSQVKKCSNCLAGKEHKVAFKSQSPHRGVGLCTFRCSQNDDEVKWWIKVLAIFIDEFSGKVWVYVLKIEDEVLSVFKQVQVSVER